MSEPQPQTLDATGTEVSLTLTGVAHGGHMVARTAQGRVVFVRHGLPGETVRARLTEAAPDASFWRADTVAVDSAVSGRRERHPWPEADALLAADEGRLPVGGAEFGHAHLSTQRELKRVVLAEQLEHLSGYTWAGEVEALPEPETDSGWRTRLHLDVDEHGQPGMYPHRSNVLVPVQDVPLATPAIRNLAIWNLKVPGTTRLDVAAPANGTAPLLHVGLQPNITAQQETALRTELTGWASSHGVSVTAQREGTGRSVVWAGPGYVTESLTLPGMGEFTWRVSATGFWQVHASAPTTLARAVLEASAVDQGETVWDLYSGAGLFSSVLARVVGSTGQVFAVEGSPVTSADAEHNHAHVPHIRSVRGDVARLLTGRGASRRRGRTRSPQPTGGVRAPSPDVVVLDPPRAGAAKDVIAAITDANPRRIVYVACDPAALGRDLGRLQRRGWRIAGVRAFDLYPGTHHVEAVAVLERR